MTGAPPMILGTSASHASVENSHFSRPFLACANSDATGLAMRQNPWAQKCSQELVVNLVVGQHTCLASLTASRRLAGGPSPA